MAVQFEGTIAEHLAVRRAAGLFDVSHMARLALCGPGADEAVERLLTRKTADMAPGIVRYSFIADAQGAILDDLMVARRDDGWLLIANAVNHERVVAQIHGAGFGGTLADHTRETAMLALQGPQSVEMMQRVWPAAAPDERKRGRLWSAERGGAELVGSRTGYTGEDGFEVHGPPGSVESLWADLRAEGAAPCGLAARDSLRNEAALPLYGHELREDTNPWEAGLAYSVSLDKDFIGRDDMLRRREHGVRQKRVGLVLAGRRIARENMPVLRGDRTVGTVTSGTWSPLIEAPIAQAYLDTAVLHEDGNVEIDVRGRREQARIVPVRELMRRH